MPSVFKSTVSHMIDVIGMCMLGFIAARRCACFTYFEVASIDTPSKTLEIVNKLNL